MNKIPTIFERDWDGDKSRVLDQQVAECAWVFAGEGVATRKYDGTGCMVKDGKLYRRHTVKPGGKIPVLPHIVVGHDEETGKTILWVEVGQGKADVWHREAFEDLFDPEDGTYELIGPKVQKNPEQVQLVHILVKHSDAEVIPDVPRTFDGLKQLLGELDVEGIVFHHPDGRMAKIKARDFGIKRGAVQAAR